MRHFLRRLTARSAAIAVLAAVPAFAAFAQNPAPPAGQPTPDMTDSNQPRTIPGFDPAALDRS
ncbi:MAG TPA: hypothetical protein VF173_33600, partial [Thermoanaerobaculia bacterium]|nr:hypothetical protein [Thermoanaerobaculia bacterium]